MQVIATGKWSKADEDWKLVLALRRQAAGTSTSSLTAAEPRKALRQRPRPRSRRRRTSAPKLTP